MGFYCKPTQVFATISVLLNILLSAVEISGPFNMKGLFEVSESSSPLLSSF